MRNYKTILTLIIVLFLNGCIPSLNPIYTESDLIFHDELLGTWTDEDSNESWKFEKAGEKEYLLTHTYKTHNSTFEAHLVKIGEYTFLDIYLKDLISNDYLYEMNVFPVHTFSRITVSKDELTIDMFDPSWLKDGIDSKEINIDHVKSSDGNILLTASTEDLKSFILMNANNKDAFEEPLQLKKI